MHRCATKGERRESAATARAEVAITGLESASSKKPVARSASSPSRNRDEAVVVGRNGLSTGPRLMVDTRSPELSYLQYTVGLPA